MAVSLNSSALATLSQVKDELGNPSGSDNLLKRYINQVSRAFRERTGRLWHRKDGYTESVVSTGDTRIMVERRPVLAINSISVKGSTVNSADYTIEDDTAGIIRLKDDFWESTAVAIRRVERYTQYHELRVDVDYDGGYVTQKQVDDNKFSPKTLPEDIESAIITSVAARFRLQGAPSRVESESIGDASISYAQPDDGGAGRRFSMEFESAVRRHRDRSVLP